jgi:hypothetical protein
MIVSEKSDLIYRTIFVKAWASSLGIQSQALRELSITSRKAKKDVWEMGPLLSLPV